MSLNAVLRFLLPKADHFYDFVERQAQIIHQAAQVMTEAKAPGANLESLRQRIQELEHQGDQQVHQMLDALSATFVTPIDREDLQRLSKRLDDIIDLLNAAIRACVTFGVAQPTQPMRLLIDKLVECTALLLEAVPKLRSHSYPEAIRICARVSIAEKDGDSVFRDALVKLFHDPAIDAKTILREREVLEDLEKAINRCENVAELITSIAVKNS
jgi:uncharacterized protein Yka (UPF0111/DUF47 family)